MQPKPGSPIAFGKYLLLERIAAGGMAEVFRAVMKGAAGFEKPVAVKRILPLFGEEQEFVTLFQDEAKIASTLAHGNIAQVFDFGEVDGSYYLTLELVEGADLSKLSSRLRTAAQPMPLATAAFIVAEAARGLGYAHEKRAPDGTLYGIVHRDVSPPNILLSYSGEVKVADFGIAKAAGKSHKTATGVVMGKLRYMSPEQVAAEELDPRTDIFSLGVILYELLVGGPVFLGDQSVRLAELIHSADIPPPSTRNPAVPPELDTIVARCLEKDRTRRYPRAAELARDLSKYVSQAAPEFTRDDLAALVQRVAPPAPATSAPTTKPDSVSLEVVPAKPKAQALIVEDEPHPADAATVPATRKPVGTRDPAFVTAGTQVERPRQLDLATQTIDRDGSSASLQQPAMRRARRRVSASLWIGLGLGAVIIASATLVVVRFVLPGKDRPLKPVVADAGVVARAPDAGGHAPVTVPTGPFELVPNVGPDERRALLEKVDQFLFTRSGEPTGDYTLFVTVLDSKIATLVIDADGHAAPPGPAPQDLEARIADSDVGHAVDATLDFVRATGELPPFVKSGLRAFLGARASVSTETTVEQGASVPPYSAAALAVWLEPKNRRRLEELALANDVLGRWCSTPIRPERHFAPFLCEPDALAAELRTARNDAWRALDRLAKATPQITLASGSLSLGETVYSTASRTELFMTVTLRVNGADAPAPASFTLLTGGASGPIAAEGTGGTPGGDPADLTVTLTFRVPRRIFAPVLQISGTDPSTYLRVPPPPWGGIR